VTENTIDTHTASTTLPGDMWQRLVAEADAEDRNVSAHVRRIIREHFARQDLEMKRDDLRSVTVPTGDDPHRSYAPWPPVRD
jgi:hypothetical protein